MFVKENPDKKKMIKFAKKLDLKFVFIARFLEKTIWKSLLENYALLVKKNNKHTSSKKPGILTQPKVSIKASLTSRICQS